MNYTQLKKPRRRNLSRPTARPSRRRPPMPTGQRRPGFYLLLTDQPGKDSWPITGASFILMHKQQDEAGPGQGGAGVLRLGLRNGEQLAESLHYVPMPQTCRQDRSRKAGNRSSGRTASRFGTGRGRDFPAARADVPRCRRRPCDAEAAGIRRMEQVQAMDDVARPGQRNRPVADLRARRRRPASPGVRRPRWKSATSTSITRSSRR